MPTKVSAFQGLTGNQLKFLAMVTMTMDHIGFILLPQHWILRIIGRLAMPIYAFLIAEGCRHTRNRTKYLLTMLAMAILCQVVSYVVTGSLYQCILVTFSLSISLIYLLDHAVRKRSIAAFAAAAAGLGAAYFLTEILPGLLPGTDFAVDYGFIGVLVPIFAFIGKTKWQKLGLTAIALVGMSLCSLWVQWFSLLALIPLALYNGERGNASLKYLFYLFYPAHIAILHLISMLI